MTMLSPLTLPIMKLTLSALAGAGIATIILFLFAFSTPKTPEKPLDVYYYSAVETNSPDSVTRLISIQEIPQISIVLYEENEQVWVNITDSKICNNHEDHHLNCRRFMIISSMQ